MAEKRQTKKCLNIKMFDTIEKIVPLFDKKNKQIKLKKPFKKRVKSTNNEKPKEAEREDQAVNLNLFLIV